MSSGKSPRSVANDLVATASGVSRIAQSEPLRCETAAHRFNEQAGDGQKATSVARAELREVAALDRSSGCGVEAPCSFVVVIVRKVRADHNQRLSTAPQSAEQFSDVAWLGITDEQRHHAERPK